MTPRIHLRRRAALPALALSACVLALAGCASPAGSNTGASTSGADPAALQASMAGADQRSLQQRLGRPTAEYPLPNGGKRLQYSQMPAGSQVWNYDFDAGGRLVNQEQALRYDDFKRIRLGQTREEEILRMFGRPMRVVRVATFDGPVWDYRFNDLNNFRIISIHIDRGGVVQRIIYNDEDNWRKFGPA